MKNLWQKFMQLDINLRSYWIGLVLLFVGLSWSQPGCTVVGAVMVTDSMLTSYIAAWINVSAARAKGNK